MFYSTLRTAQTDYVMRLRSISKRRTKSILCDYMLCYYYYYFFFALGSKDPEG